MPLPTAAFAPTAPLPGLLRTAPARALTRARPYRAARRGVVAVASGEPATAANAVPTDDVDVLSHTAELVDVSDSAIQSLDDVEELIGLVEEFNLFDFRVEDNGIAVEISRTGGRGFEDGKLLRSPGAAVATDSVVYEVAPPKEVIEAAEEEGEVAEGSDEEPVQKREADLISDPDTVYDSDFVVKSNRVGFFYSGAKNKPPLVNVGDHVDFNQPVCIIEQLGQQYVYLSEASGTVLKIFVEDGDAVEYDQQVMVIRPD